ncbi:MAG: cupin domain-containing protein [Chloroflexota bacterium]
MGNSQQGEGRVMRPARFAAVLTIAIAASVALVGPIAFASPGSGAVTTVLGHRATLSDAIQVNEDRIKFQTKGATDLQTQTITFAPGAYSGWHHHPGVIMVIVESGQVTVHEENCHTMTYGQGEAFVESGAEPMMVSNRGTTNAVVYATQIAPAGTPFRAEDDPPPCAG